MRFRSWEGGEKRGLPVYFFVRVVARESPSQAVEKKEWTELKKWNKHANAGHFPSLSLRAECKCADLTVYATHRSRERDVRDGKTWERVRGREDGDFLFFCVAFIVAFLKCACGHERRVNWMPRPDY